MKLNVKALTLLLSAGIIFSLSGCGSSSDNDYTPPATEITYTDYKGEERTAPLTPGDAEVLAGTGYQHTLFDTAEKKCQNCHNRLYDSWKSSMHSKSWSDKIFQSKHQDFLRTHLAKIGAKNAAEGTEYTTKTFGKVGKTCAKCHAPAAIYSDDYMITLTEDNTTNITDLNNSEWMSLRASLENNLAGETTYTPHEPTTVASIGKDGVLRTATYSIGHENNREGINCATCHSIETVRMMTDDGRGDNGEYTLAATMRGNVIGPVVRDANDTLIYDSDASAEDMNIFFKLVGPEKYADVANSPHDVDEYDVNKTADGRYTFRGIDKDGTDGKTHYTGGPFYGPYGVTGLSNSNEDDDTNRSAQVNPHYDIDTNNHFGDNGKALCLSCHQRSAGALVPSGADAGDFMELCTTWTAVSNGTGTNYNDIDESPKCQKCHMARVDEPMVLHQWAQPFTHFTQDDMELTEHFDPNSTTTDATNNPVIGQWMNDHAFVGGNKLGASNYKAKFQSGFEAVLNTVVTGTNLKVETSLQNKTAHMFPAAHPMRRLLTRVTVKDSNGIDQNFTNAVGNQGYTDIWNDVVTGEATNTLNVTGDSSVAVLYEAGRSIDYQGKASTLNNTPVSSQDFNGSTAIIAAPDSTVANQYTDGTTIKGTVTNAAIIDTDDMSNFTRIYGRETGKMFNGAFIVRPGFDSNIVPAQRDNRLQPNEGEDYAINYNNLPAGDYTVSYKVYYMQKGANGKFVPTNPTLIITEMYSDEANVTIPDPI